MSGLGGLMPPVIATLVADIGEFSAKMGEAKAEMNSVEGTAARTGALGKAGLLALAGGALAVGAESIHMASEFDAAMTRINTQDNANLTTKQMKDLRNSVLDLAGPTAQAPNALAEAMIHVYGSGLKGAQALDLLRIAAEGATVGHANLTDVTNALDAAVAVNIPGVQNYKVAMGELNATVGAGDMTMQNLADALGGPMLATVKGYGLSITDVGAGLAVFGDRNIRGAEAATELRMATQALAVPAKAGGAALQSIGLATDSLNKDLQQGGLKQALNDLNQHLIAAGYNSKSAGEVITQAFGKKAGGGLNVLMDSLSSSTSNFNQKFEDVAKSGQNFGKDWAETQDTLAFKIKSLESAAQALGVKLGNVLIPAVTRLLGYLQDLGRGVGEVVNWFKRHHDAAIALGAAIGGMLLFGIYTATAALWEMAVAVVAATWPFLAIGAAIAGVTYAVIYAYEHWSWFRTAVKAVGDAFVWLWDEVVQFVTHFGSIWSLATAPYVAAWHLIYDVTTSVWGDVSSFLSGAWSDLVGLWNDTGGVAVSAISDAWSSVSAAVSQEWDKIYGNLSQIWNEIIRLWDATGGRLTFLIKDQFTIIATGVKIAWDLIKAQFQISLTLITGIVKTGWDAVTGLFRIAWDLAYGITKTAWDLVNGLISGQIDLIVGILRAGWDIVLGAAKTAWDLIKAAINIPLDAIKGAIQIFIDFFTGRWGRLWTDVKNLTATLWQDIKTTISSVLNDTKTMVLGVASSIWQGFTNAIGDALTGVWTALLSLWSTIMQFFKDAGSWLFQIGKDIIQGLVNGVASMGSAVWDAAKGIAGSITGGLGSILNFGSPSKTMHQYGTWIGEGLANGITGQQTGAASAAARLAHSALAGFGSPSMTATGTVNWGTGTLDAAGMTGGMIAGAGTHAEGLYGAAGGFGTAPPIQIYLDGTEVSGLLRTKTLRYDMRNSGNGLALAGRGFR
jgi:TP901 family phage tail tape measure protein